MNKKINKFDALAHAVNTLGPPHETSKTRHIEESHGLVSNWHKWRLPCGRWLEVDEWSDGDQSTYGGAGTKRWDDPIAVRGNDDGSEYEDQARALIDAYAEAAK